MANVLIADDMQTDRELLGKVVSGAGYVPIYAENGEQAVNLAKAQRPALIFLDVVMPGQDGFATCRMLKEDTSTSSIPVVMVTSKSTDADKFWGTRQGADAYLGKPANPDEIVGVLRQMLG